MEELIINMAINIVLTSVKNPSKKAKLRKALLKVFNAIRNAYPGDPDFE